MTWFGKVSAVLALLMGAMFAVNAYFLFATGVNWNGAVYAATALGLFVGGFRTLRKMSGGLRLLAGAWGFAAGLLMLPWTMADSFVSGMPRYSVLEMAIAAVALVGLALTVTHKETKG